EANAFLAIGVHIAKETFLPATKSMPCHRDRDGHIDADHADLDPASKLARSVTVAGVERDAIAKGVVVDELDRFVERCTTYANEHWSEYFFLIDRHVRGDVIEEC